MEVERPASEKDSLAETPPHAGRRIGWPAAGAPMDDLTARIEALFRRYGTVEPRAGRLDDAAVDQFRGKVRLLIGEYGAAAVNAAMDAIPHDRSFSVH
jgi:hypothetical protein